MPVTMHPVAYRFGDSYPYHANPMHYAPSDDPRAKEISSHMKMDPGTLNSVNSPYQPWPYGGYNHGYFGSPYSFHPPYPYYPPPPPPFHMNGFYPPFPGAYPAYSVPPPHYSVEQPRYDYDKNTDGSHHCCGCNHREDEKKSKIKLEEPEVDKKTSNSLVPLLLKDYKDYPYPIMWVPPGFMNTESKSKEEEKYPHDPASLKSLEPLKQGGNGETDRDQKGGDGNRLPFPLFWFPSKNDQVTEDIKDKSVDVVGHKGLSTKHDEGSGSEAESEMNSKHVRKVIPVKQLGTEEDKKSLRNIETKAKSSSVEKTDNGMEGKEGKVSPKTSKLPPVCLRIDPLPRKKKSSRSPSPPADKGRSNESPKDSSKSSQRQPQLSEGLTKSKEEQSKANIKTIQVTNDADKVESDSKGEPCKAEKNNLSENKAALIIQSVYRGFEVRKSKPIKKLKQIAGVRKQVVELQNRISDLESSSSRSCIDTKQKLIIGETIMSLLLQLDTIQGLHPTVRDVRKSVAKELVGLQENLDSLTLLECETPSEKQVIHSEADAIQEKSDQSDSNVEGSGTGLCENREAEPIESQDDGGAEACNTNLEPQVELQSEQSTEELHGNQLQVSVETEQPLDDVVLCKSEQVAERGSGELNDMAIDSEDAFGIKVDDIKSEQLAEQSSGELNEMVSEDAGGIKVDDDTMFERSSGELNEKESEEAGGVKVDDDTKSEWSSGELNEMVSEDAGGMKVDDDTKSEQSSGELNEKESEDADGVKADDTKSEKLVEPNSEELNHIATGSEQVDDIKSEQLNDIATDSEDAGGIKLDDIKSEQLNDMATDSEQPVEQSSGDPNDIASEGSNGIKIDDIKSEQLTEWGSRELNDMATDFEYVVGIKADDIEAVPVEQSSGKLNAIQTSMETEQPDQQAEAESGTIAEAVESDADNGKANGNGPLASDTSLELHSASKIQPSADELIDNRGDAENVKSGTGGGEVVVGSGGDDRKVVEENEKLRGMVEELMTAGKEQMGVIKELTARVKDLEKKLSKNKKIKVKKCKSRMKMCEV